MGTLGRREFVHGLTAAGVTTVLRAPPALADEPPPEITKLRLLKAGSICWAPQYIADNLLRGEGFTEIVYVDHPTGAVSVRLVSGEADMSLNFVGPNIIRVGAGDPVVFLAGVHVGCFEVVANERVQRIRELKGKTVAVEALESSQHVFLSSIAAHVGLNPGRDIRWVTHSEPEALRLLAEGGVDAYLAFPPASQELRARKIGHVIVNSATDRPWSQYFCCLLTASKEFVRKHPVATKRALRAILKSTDICALDPERAARALVDKGYTARYEYALQVMKELPYAKRREYDPEDTLRFYALRLHEVGMIKSSPQKILAQGTDWRFLNEVKKELKG